MNALLACLGRLGGAVALAVSLPVAAASFVAAPPPTAAPPAFAGTPLGLTGGLTTTPPRDLRVPDTMRMSPVPLGSPEVANSGVIVGSVPANSITVMQNGGVQVLPSLPPAVTVVAPTENGFLLVPSDGSSIGLVGQGVVIDGGSAR